MKIYKTIILVLTITLLIACTNDDDANQDSMNLTIEDDRSALIEIFNANVSNTLTWDTSTSNVSTWDGVVVEDNRVTVVNIGNAGITTLPPTAMQKLTELRSFVANDNNLESISIDGNMKLESLQLFNNQLITIDVSNNILLEQLLLENNNLETLDVSMLSNLTDLKGGSNDFSDSVNIANGNNVNMWRMQLGSNNLSCVQVDAGATNGFTGWSVSSGASYSTNCN